MKKILIAMIVLLASASSCHQSDGNIGDLFGIWMLDEFSDAGMDRPVDLSLYSWRFQSSVVMITTQLDPHNYRQCTGSWTRDGEWLLLDFTHKFEGVVPPAELDLTANRIMKFKMLELTGRRMVLQQFGVGDDGYGGPIYGFRKLN